MGVTQERVALIREIKEDSILPSSVNLLKLLNLRIEENRFFMDTASLSEIRNLQGHIEELKSLKEWLFALK